ncbi:hypothetical protein J31TS4_16990 [Paenibacillus sp. J31TS4]|uniref:YbjN domain-containing protein n=1 Tax=Paenibacillus sp. J31TS4 TaxID=2807195 RepID=UPI001B2D8768|nr:YbjN domain-containing protein [Paenibacillus sp. J31TS4]GIP38419.1 hypothetical protein J31TS4_16990 [Paenibacillus sp. J31TS4]
MSNVSLFRTYLQQINVHMEEVQDGGEVYFRTTQSFENGGSVLLVVSFNDREDLVDLNIYNIANIKNPLKKEAVHSLINELNVQYRFTKFMESEGRISAQYSMNVVPNQLDPEQIFNKLIMLLRSAEDTYPKFMKLQWA